MIDILQTSLRNNILSRINANEFQTLAAHLEPVVLQRGTHLAAPCEPLPFVIFPEAGIVSVVVVSPEGQKAEGGIIGREGFVAPFVLLGTDRSPNILEVQVAGHGYRIPTACFVDLINSNIDARLKALRFAQTFSIQLSFTAMLNAANPVDERLARWILMCHDRSATDEIALTHRYMSVMLCVRRASVTVALQTLQENGCVRAERGVVTVTSRSRLEEFAEDAYGPPEAEYVRLLGPL